MVLARCVCWSIASCKSGTVSEKRYWCLAKAIWVILPIQISDIPHQSIRSLEDATTFIATLLPTKKHLATYMARRKLERQKRAGLRRWLRESRRFVRRRRRWLNGWRNRKQRFWRVILTTLMIMIKADDFDRIIGVRAGEYWLRRLLRANIKDCSFLYDVLHQIQWTQSQTFRKKPRVRVTYWN